MPPLLFALHPCIVAGRPGWRWAVHHAWESSFNDDPLAGCINAGWCPELDQADAVGQLVLYSTMNLFRVIDVRVPDVVNLRPATDIVAGFTLEPFNATDNLVIMGVLQ